MEDLRIEGLPLADILARMSASLDSARTFLVGIDGGAGAGKTTFTRWFVALVRASCARVAVVHTDHFFRPSSERMDKLAVVTDLDWERLRDEVLVPLHAGELARFRLYDWPLDRLTDWATIEVGSVVIVDGISATHRELVQYYDLRIWFSCPRDVRVSRLLGRGDTPAAEVERWLPSEGRYIAAHDPEATAHLVIDTTADLAAQDGSGWFVKRWSPPAQATWRSCL